MNSSRKRLIMLAPILIAMSIVFFITTYYDIVMSKENTAPAKNGVINYSQTNYAQNTVIALNGEWLTLSGGNHSDYGVFPEALRFGNEKRTNYELYIKVPRTGTYYSVLIPAVFTKSALYIDDVCQYDNMGMSKPCLYSPKKVSTIYATSDIIKINLIIENSENFFPTKTNSIYFGKTSAISTRNFVMNTSDFMLATICLVAFIYYIVMFMFDRGNSHNLVLAVLCIVVSIKTILSNSFLLYNLTPNMTLRTGAFLQLLFYQLTLISFVIYVRKYLGTLINNVLNSITVLLSLLAIVAGFILPIKYYIFLDIIFAGIIALTTVIVFLKSIEYMREHHTGAIFFFVSVGIVCITCLIDIFDYFTNYLSKRYFTTGFVIFIVLQTFSYIRTNSKIYEQESTLTTSLSDNLMQIKREESNFLASHLRAHFLFNALNIISGYSLFDPEKAKKITSALTVYLKQLFEHDNLTELTTLKNEIELLRAFGYIEQERFPNLNIEYDFPSNLPDIEVPSLILQPLLENAVNHGIRKKSSKSVGNVLISIKPVRGYVNFSIKDDGAGIDEDVIKQALLPPKNDKNNSLFQIQSRLKDLYNENIVYKSVLNVGTVISFRIPLS